MVRGLLVAAVVAAGISVAGAPQAMACSPGDYTNSNGNCIEDPTAPVPGNNSPPPGATAQCKDGDWSYSTHHTGTCSGHGGVAAWL